MSSGRIQSLKIKAKLLQKAKKKAGKPVPLKDALHLLATHAGYPSWRALKESVEKTVDLRPVQASAYWNTWYATHEEARRHVDAGGGYLLPFERQFFVCDINYVEALGVTKDDPDLALVGVDWTMPADQSAWIRLLEKIKKARPQRKNES